MSAASGTMGRRWTAPGLWLLAAACARPPMAPAPAPGAVRVALVDSVAFETELETGVLHRVEVRSPAGVDTVPGVLTQALPVVLADGTVLGFVFEAEGLRSAFTWHPARRAVEIIALPPEADRWFTTPAFSPDGRYLAYVAYRQGFGRGMVRRGAAGEVVVRTDSVEVPATDAALNFTQWSAPDRFEIYLDVGEPGWHRWAGTVAAGVIRADTVAPPAPPPRADP